MTRAKKAALVGIGVGAIAVALAGYAMLRTHPRGETGERAERIARALYQDVRGDRWEETLALQFTFRETRAHLWDRARGFAYVTDAPAHAGGTAAKKDAAKKDAAKKDAAKDGALAVWLDVVDLSGVATRDGVELTGVAADEARARAWAWHCNDTFWLNPVAKIFDDGVERSLVYLEGDPPQPALAVKFSSGGVTPGDTYVWRIAWVDSADGPLLETGPLVRLRPERLSMWVGARPLSLLPGITWTWERWQELATGARVATLHVSRVATVDITDVHGARTLAELPGVTGDPFAALQARRAAAHR